MRRAWLVALLAAGLAGCGDPPAAPAATASPSTPAAVAVRTPAPPPPPPRPKRTVEKKAPPPALPPMRLKGTMVTPSGGIASLEVEGEGGTRTVPQGRPLFGYRLAEVRPDSVVLTPDTGGESVVLALQPEGGDYVEALPDQEPVSEVIEAPSGVAVGSSEALTGAGLEPDDVVLSIDGLPVTSQQQVESLAQRPFPAQVEIEREGRRMVIMVAGSPDES